MAYYSQPGISSQDQERSLKNLTVNTAALLCYVGVWISGIVFLVLEQKNRFVRFHALQSIFSFGILTIAGSILDRFPIIGNWLSGVVWVAGFILWIILMIKAGQGELFKLPWIGDLAERLAIDSIPNPPPPPQAAKPEASTPPFAATATAPPQPQAAPEPPVPPENTAPPTSSFGAAPLLQAASAQEPRATAPQPQVVEPPKAADSGRRDPSYRSRQPDDFRAKYYSFGARSGRIVGSAFVIAWSIALLVFFNYFSQYIAYYHANTSGGATIWELYPLVTSSWSNWLPYVNASLIITIIGHTFMIVYDRYIARQIIHIVIDCFSLVSIIALLSIFPFDFGPIPNSEVILGLEIGLPIVLIMVAIGTVIGILVRFITFIVRIAQNKY